MTPNSSLWLRAKEIVGDALELPVEARAALIQSRCAGDPAMLSEVMAFLNAASDTSDFMAPLGESMLVVHDPIVDQAGKHFGVYRLQRELGRGGMSVVYLAERADGAYQQKVAVKLMLAATGAEAAKRVGRERQALAALNHPNIARLVDGGVSSDGIPYLVMDYVDGERIDIWSDKRGLDVGARVTLILSVCRAVQHAHQQLIVHRDLKPANILIAADGTAKLLDFGVARLLENTAGVDGADITQAGALLFTPRYASPEQVRGLPVSVSTDVYGLGVLLYELLAGSSPFVNISSQAATSTAAAMRAVLEDDCRPASKVAAEYAPQRAPALRGDLDLILAKACARDATERYATVGLLADELNRWCNSEPILARPPSMLYRAGKFVSRHRVGSALSAIGLVGIFAGVTGTIVQRGIAEDRYAQALGLAAKVTSKYYDAIESLPGSTAVRQEMTADGIQFLDQLAAGAKGDAAIKIELASGYRRIAEVMFNGYGLPNIGDRRGADAARERASKLLGEVLAAQPTHAVALAQQARLLADSGAALGATGQTDQALALIDQSIAAYQKSLALASDDAVRFNFARAHVSAAQAALSGKRSGREYLNGARAEFLKWAQNHPTSPNLNDFQALLIRTEYREAIRAGDWKSAIKHSDAEIALLAAEMQTRPDNAVYWQHQSVALLNSGVIFIERDDAVEGVARIRAAMVLTERIIAKDAVNYVVQGGLARMYMQLGKGLAKLQRAAEAQDAYTESVRRWETLAKRDLANYQVTQMGEAYWYLLRATSADKPAIAHAAARALLRHAEKHPSLFTAPPASDWVAAARTLEKATKDSLPAARGS